MNNRFLQLHMLTAYPPSNLNRDDLGRPKTAVIGGANRLRISSQCLKRTWRGSEIFQEKLSNSIGDRTKFLGDEVFNRLLAAGISEKEAVEWAKAIVGKFGKVEEEKKDKGEDVEGESKKKSDKKASLKQLVHFSPQEENAIWDLVEKLKQRKTEPTKDELESLPQKEIKAADIALFGRMMADTPDFNMEAAAQVAHAITTHRVAIEDDFFSAVDDLNRADESGSSHLGVMEFGAGLFYTYVCINRAALIENLQGDTDLAKKTIEAFIEAAATVSPSGKQNSFAALSRAGYMMVELGNQQPRSLSTAFFKPVQLKNDDEENVIKKSIDALESTKANIDRVYGASASEFKTLNVCDSSSASLLELITFAVGH